MPAKKKASISLTKTEKDQIKFRIDQLRKDKIIYAAESIAVTMMGLLMIGSTQFIAYRFPTLQSYLETVVMLSIAIPLGFWFYMVVGNLFRLKKVKQLEKQLQK